MRAVKAFLLAATAMCVMGIGADASACDVWGKVVCTTDTSIGVSGVPVTLTKQSGIYGEAVVNLSSDQNGDFSWHISGGSTYVASPGGAIAACTTDEAIANGIDLGEIQVFDALQCPGETTCPVINTAGFPACFDTDNPRPFAGNPRGECGYFGLSPLDKNEDITSTTATNTARLAIVKAGNCYDLFENVVAGETVLGTTSSNGISHITYCVCPE